MSRHDLYRSAEGARAGLTLMRIALGVFFLFDGWDKRSWMTDPGLLTETLRRWDQSASLMSHWYLQSVALQGVAVFARLMFLGEVAIGLALIFGVWTRLTAAVAFLLVLNIHLAQNSFFLPQFGFLSKGDGLPVLGALLALLIGGAGLPLSIKRSKRSMRRRP
jgi:uncharacterized membrane protein YphA (DoxX/SURF4 family)